MYVVCCVMSTIAIACCKFQSEVSSRVSCTQMKTPIVFNKSKAWLVTFFIIFFKWANTLQNVFFFGSIMGILCSNSSFVIFPLVLFLFFGVVEGWTWAAKKPATLNNECSFFSSEQVHQLSFHHSFFSILVIFCSWLYFVFKLVTLVVLPLLPFFVLWKEEHELQRKAKMLD